MQTIWGSSAADILEGSAGDDTLYGGSGTDWLSGGDGNDLLSKYQQPGASTLLGDAGEDTIWGGTDGDVIDGGDGNDSWLEGFGGDDLIRGGTGDDRLWGDEGNDTLEGGTGNDALYGGAGVDVLAGGDGHDLLYGGYGDDTYIIANTHQFIQDVAGVDTARVSVSFAKIPSTIEKVIFTNGAQALPYWIDALLPDRAAGLRFADLPGPGKTFGYAFPTALPVYDSNATDARGWSPFTALQQARAKSALAYIASVLDLNFVQTSDPDALSTITFANNQQTGSGGYAYLPSDSSKLGGDLFLDSSARSPGNAALADGSYGALTLIHELGHTLGLEHPFSQAAMDTDVADPPYLSGREDSTAWTVMSYTMSAAQYHLQFSPLDIAALQYLYGPSQNARTGNDTYSIDSAAPNFIWDGAGRDTLSAATCAQGCTLYLTPGYWGFVGAARATRITDPGQVTVNFGTTIENLQGSAHDDQLSGNEADNRIDGAEGNDTLQGGAGNDVLEGGAGDDVVIEQGRLADYRITRQGDTLTVTDMVKNRDGADTLQHVEHIRFADCSIHTGMQALAAAVEPATLQQVIELYMAFFNSVPDADGLAHWLDQARQGMDMGRMAQALYEQALQGTPVTGYAPAMGDADFVRAVYRHVLGRDSGGDEAGRAYWTAELADGQTSRGELVLRMLAAAHSCKGDTTWGWVADLVDNKLAVAMHVAVDWGISYLTPDDAMNHGQALLQAVTPSDTSAAIALVGVAPEAIALG